MKSCEMDETLPTCVKYWLNEAKHDCFFDVGPDNGSTERIGAIKILLMGDSEPLRAMLQDSELAEKKDIRLVDVEPETFRNFLKCVYGASKTIVSKLNFEDSAKLLYIVEKYLVNDVKSDLIEHMENLISKDSLFIALSHSVCCEDKTLKTKIEDILKNDFKNLTTNDQFLELGHSAIKWILQIDYLKVKEVEIWNAVVRWAKHKTGSNDGKVLRSEMIDLLKYIRFLTMDHSEFSENVVSSKILDEEEINDICTAFVLGINCPSEQLSSNTNHRFTTNPVSKLIKSSFMSFSTYAYIRCSVSSVSNLQTNHKYCSETYCWAGYLWTLIILKRSQNDIDSLGIHLKCIGEKSDWDCSADVEVMLMNQCTKSYKRSSFIKRFCPKAFVCGSSVIGWSEFINPDSGFVKDDCIIIHVKIQLKVS